MSLIFQNRVSFPEHIYNSTYTKILFFDSLLFTISSYLLTFFLHIEKSVLCVLILIIISVTKHYIYEKIWTLMYDDYIISYFNIT